MTGSSASTRSTGRSPTPTGRRRTSCASCRSTCASRSADGASISSMGRRARSTSTCSRTSRPGSTSAWPAPRRRHARVRPHPQAVGPEYGGVLFVNCGSVGKPKDGDPRGAFAILAAESRRHDRARRVRRPGGGRRSRVRRPTRRICREARRRLNMTMPRTAGSSPSTSAPRSSPPSSSARASRRPAVARRHRARAARERGRDRRRAVRDHPHVRVGLRRPFQPGRLARRRHFGGLRGGTPLAYIPAQVAGCITGAIAANLMFALARSASRPTTEPAPRTCSRR